MRKVNDDLYIGDVGDARIILQKPSASIIKSILSVSENHLPYLAMRRNPPAHIIIPIADDGSFPDFLLDVAIEFLEKCPKPVLIQCGAGISRSVTFATAWLWWNSWKARKATTIDECLKMTQSSVGFPDDMYEKLIKWAFLNFSLGLP